MCLASSASYATSENDLTMTENRLLQSFKFCPNCAAPALTVHDERKLVCNNCSFTYFHNISAATAAIIEHDSKILITVRGHEPHAGMLDLPGGFADPGETIEAALKREIHEELNLEITNLRYFISEPNIYVYKDIPYYVIDSVFTCRCDDLEKMKLSDEIAAVKFIEPGDIPLDKIAFDSIRNAIRRYIDTLK